MDADLVGAVDRAASLVARATSVTVLTGAGISTDSGIPDFRGPNGVWTLNPEAEKASDIRVFVTDPEVRRARWDVLAHGGMWDGVEPNDGHRALVPLEADGRLHTLVTQNVDGLHALAGSNPARIVEIHGTVREAMCLGCDWRAPIDVVLDRVRSGDVDRGVMICGSGVGANVAVNKVPGVRGAVCHDTYSAHQGVEHDDMNVLVLGARIVAPALAGELVEAFLQARFSGDERHNRRIGKLRRLEARNWSDSNP